MAGKPKHQQVTRFVDGRNPPGAKRKSDGEWHSFKEIISEKYKRMTLDLVMEEMKDEFQFEATRRQMVHHLEKWGVKKYKKGNEGGSGKRRKLTTPDVDMEDDTVLDSVEATQAESWPIRQSSGGFSSGAFSNGDASLPPSSSFAQGPANFSSNWQQQHSHISYNALETDQMLGEALFALGYFYAFEQCKKSCPMSDEGQMGSTTDHTHHSLEHNLIVCLRSAQNSTQASQARNILQRCVDSILGDSSDESDMATLVDLLAARTFDCGGDKMNAMGQIEGKMRGLFYDTPAAGMSFKRRSVSFDIPLFLALSYALARWNGRGNVEERWESSQIGAHSNTEDIMDRGIETTEILNRWIDQQPAMARCQDISCLSSCLNFCHQMLEKARKTNSYVSEIDLSSHYLNISVDAKDTYDVALYLWTAWIRVSATPDPSRPDLAWASTSKSQLGIPAAELLVNIVCMIMAESSISAADQSTDPLRSFDTISKGLRGVKLLRRLTSRERLDVFLRQIRKNSDKRMLALRDEDKLVNLPVLHPVRDHVYMSMGLAVPLEQPHFLTLELLTESERDCVRQSRHPGPRRSQRVSERPTATPTRGSSVATSQTLGAQFGEMPGLEPYPRGRR